MIVGVVRDSFPRVELELQGNEGPIGFEFVVDTAFEGDLSLPGGLIRQLQSQSINRNVHSLADGSHIETFIYTVDLEWNGELRRAQVVRLWNQPLMGLGLLEGCRMVVEFIEGAEVVIEFP